MTEPRRLLDESSDELARRLIGSWGGYRPSREVTRRTAAVLGVAAGISSAAKATASTAAASQAVVTGATANAVASGGMATGVATGGGATAGLAGAAGASKVAVSAPITALLFAKWCGIGLSGGLIAVGSVYGVGELVGSTSEPESHVSAPRSEVASGAARRRVAGDRGADEITRSAMPRAAEGDAVAAAQGSEAPPAPLEARSRVPLDRGAASTSPRADGISADGEPEMKEAAQAPRSIAREIAMLDRARSALRRGEPEQTLRLLSKLEADGYSPTFAPERQALRAKAERALGERGATRDQ